VRTNILTCSLVLRLATVTLFGNYETWHLNYTSFFCVNSGSETVLLKDKVSFHLLSLVIS
jgi:hypothetical protein